MRFVAACIQLNCQDIMAENIRQAHVLMQEAIARGASFITLPENAFLMEAHGKAEYAEPLPLDSHPGVRMCKDFALHHGCWILTGSVTVRDTGQEKLYNTSLLIDNRGGIAARYDKIHLFDVDLGNGEHYAESRRFLAGNRMVVASAPWGQIGMSVCYDVRFPHLYRDMAKAGATLFTVPAAFTAVTGAAHWHVLLRARAIENGCIVIAPAQCGEHPGKRRTFGHSLIISPWGEILAEAGDEVCVITAEIDTEAVRGVRARIPSLTHDRPYNS